MVAPEPSQVWLVGKVTVPVVAGTTGMSRPPPDTFSDELELVEPTTLLGRFKQSLHKGGVLHPQSKHTA